MGINIFIGSSSESLSIAQTIQNVLRKRSRGYFSEIWNQGVFHASNYFVPDLTSKLSSCTYAIFVFAPDDKTTSRKKQYKVARDNVILELGIAIGILGREKCFVFKEDSVRVPSDLIGLTTINYSAQNLEFNMETEISAAVSEFERSIAPLDNVKLPVPWERYCDNIAQLCHQLRLSTRQHGYRFDLIIGISRGGLATADFIGRRYLGMIPIVCLLPSYTNETQDTSFGNAHNHAVFDAIRKMNYRNFLLVDDISRTGKTLLMLKSFLEEQFPDCNIKTAALYVNEACKADVDYYAEATGNPMQLMMPYSCFD